MRARNDTDMRDAQGLRVRGCKSQTVKVSREETTSVPLDEIMQEMRAPRLKNYAGLVGSAGNVSIFQF